jgi:hypothetical protein
MKVRNAKLARPTRRTRRLVSFLRRIGTYLWIGLVNPGPPASTPRHTGSRS